MGQEKGREQRFKVLFFSKKKKEKTQKIKGRTRKREVVKNQNDDSKKQ